MGDGPRERENRREDESGESVPPSFVDDGEFVERPPKHEWIELIGGEFEGLGSGVAQRLLQVLIHAGDRIVVNRWHPTGEVAKFA